MASEDHEAIISPDERGRFGLKRFLSSARQDGPNSELRPRWKVFITDGGDTITLKAVK